MRKNAYVRIEIFQIILLLLLIINSTIYNFLSNYYMIGFLVIILIIFGILFGFEKYRHRYIKDCIMNILIYLLAFFIVYYLLGIFITFVKNTDYYSWYGISRFIVRVAIYVILREFFRYQVLNKCEGSKLAIILSIIVFIVLDISNNTYFYTFSDNYSIFIYIALYLLPAIGENLLATYLNMKVGYLPVIFYMLIMYLYPYLLPILPNPSKYVASIINFGVPIVLLYKQYNFFKKESDEDIARNYNKTSVPLLLVSFVFTIILVYFTSGYFHYHAIAIASGSMYPNIRKGDVVVVEKIDSNYKTLQVGDIIAFKYGDTIIVHRLINIVYDRGEYYFYTKGDANKEEDKFVIEEEMIEGKVNVKIPLIGMPTVWLNEL